MNDQIARPTIPPDDLQRSLTLARPNADQSLRHVSVVGDTYTILLDGQQTAERHCLIDMYIPPGGGPPPHRHDFEELFTVLECEIAVTFRGTTMIVHAGDSANIPANAPHSFTNTTTEPARLLCICSPSMQEAFFWRSVIWLQPEHRPRRTSTKPPRPSDRHKPRHKLRR